MATVLSSIARIRSALPLQRAALFIQRDFKLSVGTIKKGQVVQYKEKAWKVLNRDHSSSGRGGAVIKIELQDILNNAKVNERFKSSDSLEILNLQDEVHQYLYTDGANVHLLHPATFEELEMPLDTCEGGEDAASLLEDGMNIAVSFLTTPDLGRQPVVFKLPTTHIFTVESVIERAGQAAKGTVYMTAHLVNGTKIQVPEFVNAGDRIVVDIEKMRYMKREL